MRFGFAKTLQNLELFVLAWFLKGDAGMTPLPTASLTARFLEPLTHPWAAVGISVAGDGSVWSDASLEAVRVAWRLLHFLLSL